MSGPSALRFPCNCNLQVQQQLLKQHQELTSILASLYKYFEANSEEVQVEWARFTRKVRCCKASKQPDWGEQVQIYISANGLLTQRRPLVALDLATSGLCQ